MAVELGDGREISCRYSCVSLPNRLIFMHTLSHTSASSEVVMELM